MSHTNVPRPKFAQKIVDDRGIATKEFQRYLYQLWLRTGGAEDNVAGTLSSAQNLSDVGNTAASQSNLGFVNPVLDKANPGDIGGVTPATVSATTVSATTVSATTVSATFGSFTSTLDVTGAFFVDLANNVAVGEVALETTATDGFFYVPTMAGVPTGTPTPKPGLVPMAFDSTTEFLYIYSNGFWRKVLFQT